MEVYWRCTAGVWEYRRCIGFASNLHRRCIGGVLKVYWRCMGGASEMHWECIGGVSEAHWRSIAGASGVHWLPPRRPVRYNDADRPRWTTLTAVFPVPPETRLSWSFHIEALYNVAVGVARETVDDNALLGADEDGWGYFVTLGSKHHADASGVGEPYGKVCAAAGKGDLKIGGGGDMDARRRKGGGVGEMGFCVGPFVLCKNGCWR